jgi:hypothetical protein
VAAHHHRMTSEKLNAPKVELFELRTRHRVGRHTGGLG